MGSGTSSEPQSHISHGFSLKPHFAVFLVIVLACLGTSLWFTHAELQAEGGQLGVPLDDAYIHFRFAQNLATGHGFSYNQDMPAPGSTSPLWFCF